MNEYPSRLGTSSPVLTQYFCSTGTIFLKKELWSDAEGVYWGLVERNGENHAYYSALEAAIRPGMKYMYTIVVPITIVVFCVCIKQLAIHVHTLNLNVLCCKISDTLEARLEIYSKARKLSPYSMCPKRLPMDFVTGNRGSQ